MNAPMLWLGLPLALSAVLAAVHRRTRLVSWSGALLTGLLALLAWLFPIGRPYTLGPLVINLTPRLDILGRALVLEDADRPLLVFLFLSAFIWFAAARTAGTHRMFIPLGLAVLVALTGALSVEPFLYAALLIEMAVLLSIPLLNPPGSPASPGVTRYLIFQTLGMPFILFAGWMLTGLEAGSADLATTLRAGVMLGLGFAFLLAVFPFYSWIPLLTSQVEPFAAGFILYIQPMTVILFGLAFFEQYAWLREASGVPALLTLMGAVMVVTGGVWSVFHRHLGRIFGSAVIIETGFALAAAGSIGGYASLIDMLLPRLAAFALWALCLSLIRQKTGTLDVGSLAGIGRRQPLLAVGLLAAHFSTAGLPILAGFPARLGVLTRLPPDSAGLVAALLLGMAGFVVSGLYVTFRFFNQQETSEPISLARWPRFLIAAGAATLLAIGVFPPVFLPLAERILLAFPNLSGL